MNLLSLKYFLNIVDEGTISAAARRLFISQQTLSEHVKKLEEELGTPLFKRGRQLTLTLAGESLVRHGRQIIALQDALVAEIDDITKSRRRKITVAIPTYLTPVALADIILSYEKKYPQFVVSVLKRQHADVVHRMNGVDLYLSYLPLCDSLENVMILEDDPYCVTFHRGLAERIYGERWEAVEEELILTGDLGLLKDMPFLMLLDRNLRVAEDLQLIFQEYQFDPIVAINSESSGMNESFCEQGAGCLLSTESHIERRFYDGDTVPNIDLLTYPIHVTCFKPCLALSYEKGHKLHQAEIKFIEETRAYYAAKGKIG